METKLSLTIFLLLIQVSLKLRPPRKKNVMKVIEEVIQPLGSMLLRLPRRTKTKIMPRTWAISSAISVSRRVTMPTSALKSQKISGGLGNLNINDSQENGGRIETCILYLIFCHLQGSDWGPTRLGKRSQCNQPSFRSLVWL